MDYTRTDPTVAGNINMIDKSVIEALKESKICEKPMPTKSSNVDSIAEFPGLGPPQSSIKLTTAKKKNKNKNKNLNNNNQLQKSSNNYPSMSRAESPGDGTLSSIADLLGPAAALTRA